MAGLYCSTGLVGLKGDGDDEKSDFGGIGINGSDAFSDLLYFFNIAGGIRGIAEQAQCLAACRKPL